MSDMPLYHGGRNQSTGAATATSKSTTVSAGGTANIKSSWTTLIASTGFHATSVCLVISSTGSSVELIDIGIGGAGSEQIVIPDLMVGGRNGAVYSLMLPLRVPSGSRVAARLQGTTAFASANINAYLLGTGFPMPPPLSYVTAYGTVSASASSGTTVDCGGTANTLGAWTTIAASTSKAMRGLFACLNNRGVSASSRTWLVDIGIGAATSEVILIGTFPMQSAFATSDPPFTQFFPVDIPAGVRFAARAQCTDTDPTNRLIDVAIYGVS